MPPKFAPRETQEQMINRRIQEGITLGMAGASGSSNNKCTYKTFKQCDPPIFQGTEGPVGLQRWFEQTESVFGISNCREQEKVLYATHTLTDGALTWWNTFVQSVGTHEANSLSWTDLKNKMISEYCSRTDLKRLEDEFQSLKTVGKDLDTYNRRFAELALMCPRLVSPEYLRVEAYISGLPLNIQIGVTSSNPQTQRDASRMARTIMAITLEQEKETQIVEVKSNPVSHKRDGKQTTIHLTSISNTNPKKKLSNPQGDTSYAGNYPFCEKCGRHHHGECTKKTCRRCQKSGHIAGECWGDTPVAPKRKTCSKCKQSGHIRKYCPTKNDNSKNRA